MRVTHVVLSLDVGGLERNVINQIREGHKLGQTVSIICVEKPGELAPRARELGAEVCSLEKQPGFRLSTVTRIRTTLRQLRPNIVHTHQLGPLFYTGLAVHSLSLPVLVHTEHGKVDYAGRFRSRWLGRFGGIFVNRFYCLSQDMADAVIRSAILPPRRVHVINNGIAIEDYQVQGDPSQVRELLGIPRDAYVVGSVGRLHKVKRYDVLLSAFADVLKQVEHAHLLLVGDGMLRDQLAEQAEALGISNRVHFAGYQASTVPFLQAMDVFVLPSQSEGMPQAALEASAAGLPVVASRVGGLPELIQDQRTGLLFEVGNATQLTQCLFSVLTNPLWANRLGQAAQQHVEAKYHVRQMAARYHHDYLELLAPANR